MKKVLLTLIILATAAFFAAKADVELSDQSSVVRNLDLFNTIYKELNTFYVDTIDASKTIENAINAMLDDIDPYTEYIPARDREDFQVIATGEYGGIGSYIMKRNNGVYISEPYKGSPAAKAGLRPGDRIIMINGDSIAGLTQDQVSNKLKGQANTSLTVTVARPYCDDSIKTIHITREKIIINPVTYYGVTRESIGYIKLSTFNESSAEQVKTALLALKANPDVKQIVLDLRGNGG
ncbi:MAG: PDZ domain-containing protein, partial [Muribaculaceae bacterium]|nr:PDZ domain-containing protein [Muribaculaceae bacterium]